MKAYRKRLGFTLVEIIIVLAMVGIITGIASTMMVYSMRSQDVVSREYQIQADMRLASEVVNQNVRHATAVFMLNQDQFQDSSDLKDGWNYFTLSDDRKQIVHYVWDEISGSHNRQDLIQSQDNMFYGMSFRSDTANSRLVEFSLDGYIEGNGHNRISIKSELNALNSVVVDDTGNVYDPALTLVYRSEDIPDPEKVKVAVTMVLDTSGSMGYQMGGGNTDIRITVMKQKAKELIDTFAGMDNVYIALVPFASRANNPVNFLLAMDNSTSLKGTIDGFYAYGGTNAGDGLRRSYFSHDSFNSSEADRVLNYTILLMDGNPTYWPADYSTNYYSFGSAYFGSNTTTPALGGNGSSTIDGSMDYIEAFSNLEIKDTSAAQSVFMKTFVIGFTGVPAEVSRAQEIANYHTHPSDARIEGMYYAASNSEELEEVFETITEYILQETWHIYGPLG